MYVCVCKLSICEYVILFMLSRYILGPGIGSVIWSYIYQGYGAPMAYYSGQCWIATLSASLSLSLALSLSLSL